MWVLMADMYINIILKHFSQEAETVQAQKWYWASVFGADMPLWENLSEYKQSKQTAVKEELLFSLGTACISNIRRPNS